MSDAVPYCGLCEQIREPNDNGDCHECGTLMQPIKIDVTPNQKLRELIEEWRGMAAEGDKHGHNADVDKGLQTALNHCAEELVELINDE